MIIWLPLEPLEERYTKQWETWFPRQFVSDGVRFLTIEGTKLTDKVEIGSVLDAYGTVYYKMHQMAKLIDLIHSGNITSSDTILIADAWYPGLEALQYIGCLGGHRPKIVGILHAGTWDNADFTVRTNMRPWARDLETSWLKILDLIFVATRYHKNLILQDHYVDPNKIVVTGLPFYPGELTNKCIIDPNQIVFPHRMDKEKHPEMFDALIDDLWKDNIVVNGVKTAPIFTTKSAYYDTLARSRIAVSFATQETFGYAMLEATALGCIPFVPDSLSYREMYPHDLRYRTYPELKKKVESVLGSPRIRELYERIRQETALIHATYEGAITLMIKEIQHLKGHN